MKTTINNYSERIALVDVSAMPETLQKGHRMAEKDQAKGWAFHKKNDNIRRVLNLYFEKLDEYIAAMDQAQSKEEAWAPREMQTAIVSSEKPKAKKQAKKETKKSVKPGTSQPAKQASSGERKVNLPEPEWAVVSNIQKSNKEFESQKRLTQWIFDHIEKTVSRSSLSSFLAGVQDIEIDTPFTPMLKKIREKLKAQTFGKDDKFKVEASKNTREALAALLANYAFDTVKYNEENQCFAVNFPIKDIHTDTARFQNRKDAFSELSARSVAENFDANKFDPIVVWTDPKDGKTYVLSGHSRLEGMKRRKAKTIPVRYFSGTEKQAIQFSKVEANRSQNVENLVEDIEAYKLLRDGDKSKGIEPKPMKEIRQVFDSKTPTLEHFSYLNPKGLFMQALSQDNTTEFPYLERTARWVGELRKKYKDRITNLMEDNCFNFFYADKQGKNTKLAKDQFMEIVEKRLDTMTSKERVLFTQDGQTVSQVKKLLEDKLKGEGYKKLKEINEIKRFISERLKTTDRKLKVWTEAEEDYLRNTLSKKLDEEKARIERDLNYLDEQQSLFGLAGCDCQPLNGATKKRGPGRPKGSKTKRGPGRPKGSKTKKRGLGGSPKGSNKSSYDISRWNLRPFRYEMNLWVGNAWQHVFRHEDYDEVLMFVTDKPDRIHIEIREEDKVIYVKDIRTKSAEKLREIIDEWETEYEMQGWDNDSKSLGQVKQKKKPTKSQGLGGLPGEQLPAPERKPAANPPPPKVTPTDEKPVPKKMKLNSEIDSLFVSSADQERPTFILPGNVGKFLGRIEQFEYALALRGDKGAGKSTFAYRLMNSAAQWGMNIAFISLEMSPRSAVYQQMLDKYVDQPNQAKIRATDEVDTLEKLEKVASSGHFDMIVIDSWTKLREIKPQHFDYLRKTYPNIFWIVIFQSTTAGTARSGYMAEYDAQAVIQVDAEPVRGTAIAEKNRYSDGHEYTYNVFTDQITEENQKSPNAA